KWRQHLRVRIAPITWNRKTAAFVFAVERFRRRSSLEGDPGRPRLGSPAPWNRLAKPRPPSRQPHMGSFAAIPLPDGERKGPIAKQWEDEGRRSFRSILN